VKTFKAAVLVETGRPLVLAELELPEILYGQVLVKVHYSGICGSQIGEMDGVKGPDRYLPHLLGHEGGGEVIETGPGVRTVGKGDRVVLHWRKGAGIDSPTPTYAWGDRTVNAGWVTTFNEYAVVSENRVTRVPDDLDLDIAALLGCAVTTGLGVVNNDAHLKIGESIVVYGVGGIGLSIVQGASLVAAHPVIGVDRSAAKLEMAKKFGATHVIHSLEQDSREEVLGIAGKEGVDVAVDTTGVVKLIEEAYEVTSRRGRTILVGVPSVDERIRIHSLPLHFEKVLTGSYGGQADPAFDIPRYVRLHRQGRLELKGMITHTFPLDEVNEAIAMVRKGDAGRCVIRM